MATLPGVRSAPLDEAIILALGGILAGLLLEGGNLRQILQPTAALTGLWRGVLGDTPATQVVAMCGSGVTACHNLLAMELAGLPGARLYAGSFSEWMTSDR